MTETIISTFPEILYQTFNTDLTIIVVSFEVLGLKHEILVKKTPHVESSFAIVIVLMWNISIAMTNDFSFENT